MMIEQEDVAVAATQKQLESSPIKLPSPLLVHCEDDLECFLPSTVSHSPSVSDWIAALAKPDDRQDVESFCRQFPNLTRSFIPVSIIGEGTFSTVYKAIDVNYYRRDNREWHAASNQDDADAVRLWMLAWEIERLRDTCRDGSLPLRERKEARDALKAIAVTPLIGILREHVVHDWLERAVAVCRHNHKDGNEHKSIVPAAGAGSFIPDQVELAEAMASHPPHFVAIKRINATSSPSRILDELSYLRVLGGRHHVIPIITGCRFEDQVLVVFPYFHHEDFRELLPSMDQHEIACYMRLLLQSLAWIHQQGIIHRDVKPSNFLYTNRTLPCSAVLVDFGLAQVSLPSLSSYPL